MYSPQGFAYWSASGCLFYFFFLLSFLRSEQEGRFYSIYPPLNFSVYYLAIAQRLLRNELLKEIKQLSKLQVDIAVIKPMHMLHVKNLTVTQKSM